MTTTTDQIEVQKTLFIKMASLGFSAVPTRILAGPVVTQYFYKPHATSVLSKILNKTEDLALAVGAPSLIVQRTLDEISISVPNKIRHLIRFDECLHWLATQANSQNTSNNERPKFILPMLMGQDSQGINFTLDLATQPHVLIAGSTGSGKSVFLSQLITSLAVQFSPQELQFHLVDTKQLDLTLFKSLPHVTQMIDKIEDLYDLMDALLHEVRRRTELMKGLARNISEYNSMCTNMGDKPLPYYILVIDELADVISQDKELAADEDKDSKRKRISTTLAQLAQISRAAGIHIIAATQRPSVKVISGDIKTNFPTRISFRLPSSVDSRVILDENGAECLLGQGDYLYRTATDASPVRAHGSFVSMQDIARILTQHEYIRESFKMIKQMQEQS